MQPKPSVGRAIQAERDGNVEHSRRDGLRRTLVPDGGFRCAAEIPHKYRGLRVVSDRALVFQKRDHAKRKQIGDEAELEDARAARQAAAEGDERDPPAPIPVPVGAAWVRADERIVHAFHPDAAARGLAHWRGHFDNTDGKRRAGCGWQLPDERNGRHITPPCPR